MTPLKSSSPLFATTVQFVIALTLSSCYRETEDRVETSPSQQQFESKNQDDNNSLLNKDGLLDTVKKSAQSLGVILDEKSSQLEQSAKQEVSKLLTLEYKVVFIKAPEFINISDSNSQKTIFHNQNTTSSLPESDASLEQVKNKRLGADIFELEEALRQLGADSWDCYSLLDTQEGTRLTCKRPSQSYLRWILKRNPLGF